jgi:hypothetical protein
MLMNRPCPPAGSMPANQVSSIEQIIPPTVKRNIAVIAYTELRAVTSDISKAIPFVGMLIGFAYIGHAVWIFEGHPCMAAANQKRPAHNERAALFDPVVRLTSGCWSG